MALSGATALVMSKSTCCHLLRWLPLFFVLGANSTVTVHEGQLAHQQQQQSTSYAEFLGAPLLVCPVMQQQDRWEGKQEPGRRNGTNSSRPRESTKGPVWVKGSVCHETPGGHQQLFCAYTQPSFQDGFGISIITTPETFERILALDVPVLRKLSENLDDEPAKQPSQASEPSASKYNHTKSPSPAGYYYQTVPVPGKGLGMRATRPIGANEVYMSRTPAVMVDDAAVQGLGVARLTSLLMAAVDALPAAHREEFLSLTTHKEVETRGQKVHAIFDKNNFLTNWEGVGVFHSTFTHGKLVNHVPWKW